MLGGVQGAGAPSTGGGGRREADVGRGGSWIFRCSADFSSAAAEGLFTCRGLAALIFAFARGKATVPLGIAADIRQQLACYNDSLGLRSGGRQLLGFGRCFLSERHCVFSLVARLCVCVFRMLLASSVGPVEVVGALVGTSEAVPM